MNTDVTEKLQIEVYSEIKIESIKNKYIINKLLLAQKISEIDEFIISIIDTNNEITESLLNKKISVYIEIPDKITDYPKQNRVINYTGYIYNFFSENNETKNKKEKIFTLDVKPSFYILNEGKRRKIYQNKSCIEIIEEIFKESNYSEYTLNISDKSIYKKMEYITQYDESNLDFISRLLEQNRIFFLYIYDINKKNCQLIISDNYAQFKDETKSEFNVVFQFSSKDKFTEIFPPINRERKKINSILVNAYNYKIPKTKLTKQQKNDYLNLFSIYGENFVSISEVENYLTTLLLEKNFDAISFESFIRRPLDIGTKIKIKSKDYAEYDGEYIIARREIKIEKNKLLYKIIFFPANVKYAPNLKLKKPIVNGIQLAVVVGNKNENVYVNKSGTIRVQFYWDQDHEFNQESSNDIRVSQFFGGRSGENSSMGAWFIPRIGQEVVVGFINGDPDQPIILGCLYNGANASPFEGKESSDGYTKSGIKTCSIPDGEKGHELIFEDKKDEEKITLSSAKDLEILVANDSNLKIQKNSLVELEEGDYTFNINKGNRKVSLKEGNYSITIEKGELIIETDKNITIKSKENISLSADKNLELTAENISLIAKDSIKNSAKNNFLIDGNNIKSSAKTDTQLTAAANMKISGGTATNLKGPTIGIESNLSFEMKGTIGKIEASGPLEIKGAITKLN
ncbi:type VI secretion system tip protein TssI/VgrG [Pigmentibacter sp. JX0631]|uniref:type VI secretion system Vgr family protein n=1 Tax=Pigmentibacter sp. JX0631 TaxID=2976982 RepID=UPI0024692D8C|nr:type VI secretion system tip protein TssI/VgrG [Pigmentibacter sp. JX0631]WGL60330.1 type VI secretion system tip protein TssI/VgrG [Pigmentibacter sp. JX0631]